MDVAKQFWSNQVSSRHRLNTEEFFREKAKEHAGFFRDDERDVGCLDLGCGAGEILYFFSDYVKVEVAIDYSDSMISEAKNRLSGKEIDILNRDLVEYLKISKQEIWVTSAAINQYLDEGRLREILDFFCDNADAKGFFLYDCVDPIRIQMLPYGIGYMKPPHATGGKQAIRSLYRMVRRGLIAARFAAGSLGQTSQKLRGDGMGYGFLPRFWHEVADEKQLEIEIVSSRYYEYRYHVLLRKTATA